jgi:DNA-binding transcriptional MerR regulator
MKISELTKRTGVPKETVHFYIREGLLRKPHKSGVNTAEYNDNHVERLLLIKDLRDNHYLPIPEIKKVLRNLKKQSPSDQAVSRFKSRYFRPMDQLLESEVSGREAFCQTTGLGPKWLSHMEAWGVITPRMDKDQPVYSQDDVIIGRLLVDIDQLGFGPKDGYDPRDLQKISDFIQDYVRSGQNKYLTTTLKKIATGEYQEGKIQIREVMSLFFYHMYRKRVREQYQEIIDAMKGAGDEKAIADKEPERPQ